MSLADDYKELIRCHDGDMALLYIYMNSHATFDRTDAAIKLDMTMKQVAEAEEKLGRSELIGTNATAAYTDETILLSVTDVETVLAFPFEALALYFLHVSMYGADNVPKAAADLQRTEEQILELKKRLGMLRLLPEQREERTVSPIIFREPEPSPEYFDDEPEPYADLGQELTDEPEADHEAERKKLILEFAAALDISGRPLTPLERKYIGDWIEIGFRDPEAIRIAYERTWNNLGRMKWEYTDKIIRSWHSQKLYTPVDILEHDKRHRSTSSTSKKREAERAARRNKTK